ncbi:50S ribosomal protein L18 [Candidatus Woesearchaeota archaeon]|nr:50S ribosomal protein L18 [Candidatus Woesearchaeota archaeon]
MKRNKPQTVFYRRKREGRTNYVKRLHFLLARKPRLVVRFTNTKIIAQVVSFETSGDRILVGIDSTQLQKYDWSYSSKNLPAAYLTGVLIGKKGVEKGIKEVILDAGLITPLHKGKIYAFLRGVLDGGLNVAHGEEKIFPSPSRFKGEHIASYLASSPEKERTSPQFAQYLKKSNKREEIGVLVDKVKGKILH